MPRNTTPSAPWRRRRSSAKQTSERRPFGVVIQRYRQVCSQVRIKRRHSTGGTEKRHKERDVDPRHAPRAFSFFAAGISINQTKLTCAQALISAPPPHPTSPIRIPRPISTLLDRPSTAELHGAACQRRSRGRKSWPISKPSVYRRPPAPLSPPPRCVCSEGDRSDSLSTAARALTQVRGAYASSLLCHFLTCSMPPSRGTARFEREASVSPLPPLINCTCTAFSKKLPESIPLDRAPRVLTHMLYQSYHRALQAAPDLERKMIYVSCGI